MKNLITIVSVILISFFLFTVSVDAQIRTSFIPDIDQLITSYEIVAESNHYSDMYDPGYSVYPGFPKQGMYSILSPKTGAIYCNLDADVEMEILFGAGETLYAVKLDGSAVPGWPKTFTQYYEVAWGVSFGDVDGDGQGDVVVSAGGPLGGHIHAFKKDGTLLAGFPVNVGKYAMNPTLADLDGDGAMEILIGTRTKQAFVYKGDGTVYPGWPKMMDWYVAAAAAAGDVNDDGVMDVVMESRNLLYVWNKDGQILPGFPYAIMDSTIGSNSYSAPVLVDLTGDGKLEIVFCSHSDSANAGGIVYAVKHDGTSLPGFPKTVNDWIYGAPITADIDGDSELEIIIAEYGSSPTPQFYVYAFNLDGSMVTNFPMGPYHGTANQILVADIDNDGQFEIIFDENVVEGVTGRYRALNMDGSQVTGWPLELTQNTSFQQPLLGDLNNDGTLDMVGGSFNFDPSNKQVFLYVWNTGLPYNPAKIVNPMYQFNPQHSGVFVDPSLIPVELESFWVTINGSEAALQWITATELNNSGFEVERSADNINWDKIGFVQGNGSTTNKTTYTFVDANPITGKSYYRLKQIDYDGTHSYSNIITAEFYQIINYSIEQNYPNPFNPATIIKYNLPEESSVQVKIFNAVGELVSTLVDEIQTEGKYSKLFDASKLSSGVYFAVLNAASLSSNASKTEMIKMLYLK